MKPAVKHTTVGSGSALASVLTACLHHDAIIHSPTTSQTKHLLLDGILSSEHLVDLGQVVGTREESVRVA